MAHQEYEQRLRKRDRHSDPGNSGRKVHSECARSTRVDGDRFRLKRAPPMPRENSSPLIEWVLIGDQRSHGPGSRVTPRQNIGIRHSLGRTTCWAYFFLPPSGPQCPPVQGWLPVGRTGVVVITAFGPVWIGMDLRDDLGVVTTAFGPRWNFDPPAAVTAVRRQFPLRHSKQAFGEHPTTHPVPHLSLQHPCVLLHAASTALCLAANAGTDISATAATTAHAAMPPGIDIRIGHLLDSQCCTRGCLPGEHTGSGAFLRFLAARRRTITDLVRSRR